MIIYEYKLILWTAVLKRMYINQLLMIDMFKVFFNKFTIFYFPTASIVPGYIFEKLSYLFEINLSLQQNFVQQSQAIVQNSKINK